LLLRKRWSFDDGELTIYHGDGRISIIFKDKKKDTNGKWIMSGIFILRGIRKNQLKEMDWEMMGFYLFLFLYNFFKEFCMHIKIFSRE
jgi:hypothetical protein